MPPIASWSTRGADPHRARRHVLWRAAAILFLQPPLATTAWAQLSGGLGVESDYRLRGYSLSAGRPVMTGRLGYDDASGLYVDGYAVGEFAREDVRFLGWDANIGYARRLGGGASADIGIIRRQYGAGYSGGRASHYTELHAGLTLRPVALRLYYSPDYPARSGSAFYGEVEGALVPSRAWRVDGHLGALAYAGGGRAARYDWRLGLSRLLGAFDIHAAISGGGPGRQYYYGSTHDRTALTAGARWNF